MGRRFEIHAFRFGDAELRQVALMFNDITERKRYEDSIEQSRQVAEQARMAADASNRAKSECLANMSHDIRTPLSVIPGLTEILDSNLHDPDDIQAVVTISRRLARLLGGDITFVRERHKGSTFTLDLVLDPEQLVTLTSRTAPVFESDDIGDQLAQLSAHIMVVDDRPDIRAFRHHHLEDFGATVESFSSGEAALAHMAAEGALTTVARDSPVAVTPGSTVVTQVSAVCDVILLDMQMPGLDGYETASRMRAAGCTGPIVALTAAVLGNERERSAQAGCTDYLSKPIRRAELLKALSSHLLPHQFVRVRGVQDSGTYGNDPVVHDSTRHERHERQQSSTLESQRCRILVVEDHDGTRQAIMRILSRHGYKVVGAASAEEARKRVSTSIPQVIFLDIGLPGADGLLLAREFRQHPRLRESRLVCVSGTSFDDQSEEVALFDAVLLKPVDRAMLLRTIARIAES